MTFVPSRVETALSPCKVSRIFQVSTSSQPIEARSRLSSSMVARATHRRTFPGTVVFKTTAIDRSAIPPRAKYHILFEIHRLSRLRAVR
jgi:hypothetical protein